MPLVEIDLLEAWAPDQIDAIADAIHEAMVETLGVPERAAGRDSATKQHFYSRFAALLAERATVQSADLTAVLVENSRDDWSFGMGQASYLELPRHAWR